MDFLHETDKFIININAANRNTTFMNDLFDISSENKMKKLKVWLVEEEYDTEAVSYDIENGNTLDFNQTNIGQKLQNKLLYQQIANFIHDAADDAKLYSVTVSNVFRFIYWDHNKEYPLY
eukprot:33906_1